METNHHLKTEDIIFKKLFHKRSWKNIQFDFRWCLIIKVNESVGFEITSAVAKDGVKLLQLYVYFITLFFFSDSITDSEQARKFVSW